VKLLEQNVGNNFDNLGNPVLTSFLPNDEKISDNTHNIQTLLLVV
jgi:hypothetical protein